MKEYIDQLRDLTENASTPISEELLWELERTEQFERRLDIFSQVLPESPDREQVIGQMAQATERFIYDLRRSYRNLIDMVSQEESGPDWKSHANQLGISDAIQIRYDGDQELLQVKTPSLLPINTRYSYTLPEAVAQAVCRFQDQYTQAHGRMLRMGPVIVVLVHHISTQHKRRYRDYDNIEFSAVLNALQTSLIFNDSPRACTIFHMAVEDAQFSTEFLITPIRRWEDLFRQLDFSLYEPPVSDPEKGAESSPTKQEK